MRAPFQILAIPYKMIDKKPLFCVLNRADYDQWQFVAGGGEDLETPKEAAKREILEESGVLAQQIIELRSMCSVCVDCFPKRHLYGWPKDTYVIPEYSFAFECTDEIKLSNEHTQCLWLDYESARQKLTWDSNKTALYELNCILNKENSN